MSSGAFLAGMAGGVMAGDDPRRGVRRVAALLFTALAVAALAIGTAMQVLTQHGEGLVFWVLGTLFWSWVICVGGMKWATWALVSPMKALPRAIEAARQTTAGKVWGIGLLLTWVLAVVAGAALNVPLTIFALLAMVVFSWGTGLGAGNVATRVMLWMEEARDLVAQALPCDPGQLSGGNSGDLRHPELTLEYPWVLSSEQNATFIDRLGYLGRGSNLAIVGVAPEGITVCEAKHLAHHQSRKR